MIKLTDLIGEIEFRDQSLNVDKEDISGFFLEAFGFPEDALDDKRKWDAPIDDVIPNFFSIINKKKKVISKVGSFELIKSPSYPYNLYLVNTDAETNDAISNLNGYLAGFISISILDAKGNLGLNKPFKMTGAEILLTYVNDGYRGMGLGTLMYQMLLNVYKTIFSDSILYESSKNIWVNKLAPMANGKSIIFGGQVNNIIVPLSVEDASNSEVMSDPGFERYFITMNPPVELRKIAGAVYGLSITNKEYGIYQPKDKMNAQQLIDIADTVDSIPALIKAAKLNQIVGYAGAANQFEKILVETENAIVVVDDLADTEII